MKSIILLIFCLITCNVYGQKIENYNIHNYFKIEGKQVEYQGKLYPNIYPSITKNENDSIGIFLNQNRRRFEYILMNRSSTIFGDSTFQSLFPDTIQMSKIYREKIIEDQVILGYLNAFIAPNDSMEKRINYTKQEMMKVASRFFLCESVNPNKTIFWHVCIGINGQEEAGWEKDYTLLEAFCFEAIFDGLSVKDKNQFMQNFISYVKEAEVAYKDLSMDLILEKARNDVFEKMENDFDLQSLLLAYYETTKNELPFKL